jgi:hypothetical protein
VEALIREGGWDGDTVRAVDGLQLRVGRLDAHTS